eukprot:jgi/Psemu1/183863/e_gw1.35.149.1
MLATSSISSSRRSSSDVGRWVQRDFLKEKLRVRERYWHPIASREKRTGNSNGSDGVVDDDDDDEAIDWIIPDGLAWRTYLPLIIYLVEQQERHCKQFDPSRKRPTKRVRKLGCRWVLLESVADWMDYRNVSPRITADSVHLPPEMASPHERSKI